MTQAAKSYSLRNIFWRMTGNPFCDEIGCPLFNSHRQEGVIKNQIRGTLCDKHKNILEESKC
ncbi:MAG: DUF6775 family putative metallopeptidase [Candidatus Saliniplasma sp.]